MEHQENTKEKGAVRSIIGAALSLGVMGGLLYVLDWKQMGETLSDLSVGWVFAAFLLMVLQIGFLAIRWHYLVSTNGISTAVGRKELKSSAQVMLASLAVNQMFLASITGAAVRIILSVVRGIPVERAMAAAVLDRGFSFGILLFLVIMFFPSIVGQFDHRLSMIASGFSILGILVGFVGVVLLLRHDPYFLRRIARRNRPLILAIHHARRTLQPYKMLRILVLSLAAQFSFFGAALMVAEANAVELNFWDILMVLPLVSIIASIPLSIGGWGIREGAFVYGLGLLGVPGETAFLVSVQVGALSMASALVCGVPALLSGHVWSTIHKGLKSTIRKKKRTFPNAV
jgi:uncharacterized membrane protein YbhN (UPF0104 family)